MSTSPTFNEEFSSPNTAFAKDMNLSAFDQERKGNKAELSRKSLYVAFDPLVNAYVIVPRPFDLCLFKFLEFVVLRAPHAALQAPHLMPSSAAYCPRHQRKVMASYWTLARLRMGLPEAAPRPGLTH
jgi:hypothetical protein